MVPTELAISVGNCEKPQYIVLYYSACYSRQCYIYMIHITKEISNPIPKECINDIIEF